ncbi:MAG: hypothetical protein PF630_05910, partial [Gammaproteobacteria bacterium]|nr:hypothetical protein [Gammaproteobacteria bacterium]
QPYGFEFERFGIVVSGFHLTSPVGLLSLLLDVFERRDSSMVMMVILTGKHPGTITGSRLPLPIS